MLTTVMIRAVSNQGNGALAARGFADPAEVVSGLRFSVAEDVASAHFPQLSDAQRLLGGARRCGSFEDVVPFQLRKLLVVYLLCRIHHRFFTEHYVAPTPSRLSHPTSSHVKKNVNIP